MDSRLLRRASDRSAASYDERFGPLQQPKYDLMLAALDGDPPGRDWLDAGCGTGLLATRLSPPAGGAWTGVDLSRVMLERAAARGMRPVQADLDALPLADRSFDAVFCFTALVDRPSAEPGVTELARVLRPGGRLVLTLLPHDVPEDLESVAQAGGLVPSFRGECGQDVGFVFRRAMLTG